MAQDQAMVIAALVMSIVALLLCIFVFVAWGLGVNPPLELHHNKQGTAHIPIHSAVSQEKPTGIPQILHMVYGLQDTTQALDHSRVKKWQSLHPGFTVKIWNRAMCEHVVTQYFDRWSFLWSHGVSAYNVETIQASLIPYMILYVEGGWYVDHESVPLQSLRSLETLTQPPHTTTVFLEDPTTNTLSTKVLGSMPYQPWFEVLMSAIQERCQDSMTHSLSFLVGSDVLTQIIRQTSTAQTPHGIITAPITQRFLKAA